MKQTLIRQFPLLKDKNILLYYIYAAIYGLYPINAVVALYFIFKGLSFAQIGIIFTVFSLSSFFFEIPTGYLGDEFGRKKSILLGLWTLTGVAFAWTLATNYIHFSFLAAIWMFGFACISGSFEAYIYDYLDEHTLLEKYDGVLAKSQMLFFYFGSIGAIIGTFLYAVNHHLPYYLLGITFFASSIAVLFMDTDVIRKKKLGEENLHILAGIKKIVSSKSLTWVTLFISFFFGYYHFFINSVNSPYILSLHVFDIKLLGTFMAIVGIVQGTISSKFDTLRKKLTDSQLIIFLSIVQISMLIVMGYFTGIIGLIAIFLFMQIEPFEQILLNSFSQKFISSSIRATTISSMKLVGAIIASLTGYIIGTLVDRVGINASFIYVAVWIFAVLSILMSVKKKYNIKL